MTELIALKDALRGLLGPGIGIGVTDPRVDYDDLHASEATATTRMVPKRRLEFTAGRHAARAAMADLNLPPAPIPIAETRAPVWPTGLVGSIAHCRSAAIATVTLKTTLHSVGLDIEEVAPLSDDLWDTVCTESECNWLASQPAAQQGLLAKHIFVAKEAIYKAQHPLTGQLIGFEAVEITLHSNTVFTASADQHTYSGQWADVAGLILCTVPVRVVPINTRE